MVYILPILHMPYGFEFGLAHTMYGLCIKQNLVFFKTCVKYWGGKYTIWLNHIHWGFKICMGMETNVIVMLPNYGKAGSIFGSGYQLVPLMHLGFCGSPSLRLGS